LGNSADIVTLYSTYSTPPLNVLDIAAVTALAIACALLVIIELIDSVEILIPDSVE
jgi:hypothetical protein